MPGPARLITLNLGSQTVGVAEFRVAHGGLVLVNYRLHEVPLDQETGQQFIRMRNETFPSSRCVSAIQIVRPQESIAETQSQLRLVLIALFQWTISLARPMHKVKRAPRFPAEPSRWGEIFMLPLLWRHWRIGAQSRCSPPVVKRLCIGESP
jgi:hypothetical protein